MATKSLDRQPEALRSLKTAARSGSKKPKEQGLTASGSTAPRSAPLDRQEETAARILRAGAAKDPAGMEKEAKKAPKR